MCLTYHYNYILVYWIQFRNNAPTILILYLYKKSKVCLCCGTSNDTSTSPFENPDYGMCQRGGDLLRNYKNTGGQTYRRTVVKPIPVSVDKLLRKAGVSSARRKAPRPPVEF